MSQVILLEKIEKLGEMGDEVSVKPGFARNYLLPQNKALRATADNRAYFESQRAQLEKANDDKRKEAEKHADSLKNLHVVLIRQAGESGQLYGSVTARDIADAVNDMVEKKIARNMVELNQNLKDIGIFNVTVALHPEVKRDVTINIARTEDEAKQQKKTGQAVTAEADQDAKRAEAQAAAEASKEALMDESALEAEKEAEKEAEAAQAAKQAEEEAKSEGETAEAEADSETADTETSAAESKEEEKN